MSLSNRIEQPDSRARSIDASNIVTTTRVFKVPHPEGYDSLWPIGTIDVSNGTLMRTWCVQGAGFDTIHEEWVATDLNGGVNPTPTIPYDRYEEYTPNSVPVERPLAVRSNYLTKWDWNLYANTSDAETPSWHATATDRSNGTGQQYVWAKDWPGTGWYLIESRTKQTDTFLGWYPVIRRRVWSSSLSYASSALDAVNELHTPGQRFGYSGFSWKVTDASLDRDGNWWVAYIEYTGAASWDPDLVD